MLLMSLACDEIALGSNQVEVEVNDYVHVQCRSCPILSTDRDTPHKLFTFICSMYKLTKHYKKVTFNHTHAYLIKIKKKFCSMYKTQIIL
jgi:hypothetical protein